MYFITHVWSVNCRGEETEEREIGSWFYLSKNSACNHLLNSATSSTIVLNGTCFKIISLRLLHLHYLQRVLPLLKIIFWHKPRHRNMTNIILKDNSFILVNLVFFIVVENIDERCYCRLPWPFCWHMETSRSVLQGQQDLVNTEEMARSRLPRFVVEDKLSIWCD